MPNVKPILKTAAVKWEKVLKGLPPERAEPMIRRMATQLPKIQGNLAPLYTSSQQLLGNHLWADKIKNMPAAAVRLKESYRDAVQNEKYDPLIQRYNEGRITRPYPPKPSFSQAANVPEDTEYPITHGGGLQYIQDYLQGKEKGYRLENDDRKGLQVHRDEVLHGPAMTHRPASYANRAASINFDQPAILRAKIKAKHLITANNRYENAITSPEHLIDPQVTRVPYEAEYPGWVDDPHLKDSTEPIRKQADEQQPQVSDTQRFLALKALREYMFLHHPVQYGASDFVEDIPQIRPYGMFAHDFVPSAGVISSNPEKRHEQIETAKSQVSGLHESHNLPKEMLYGATTGAAAGVPISALFSAAGKIFGKGKGFLPRIRPSKVLHEPRFRSKALGGIGKDMASGAILGTGVGASVPIFSHQVNPSDQALDEAGKILQKAPYASGIPGADIMASYNYNNPKEDQGYQTGKNTVLGAGLGAFAGASGSAIHQGTEAARTAVFRAFGSKEPYTKFHMGRIGKPSLIGAGLGAGVGLLNSALLPSQY